MATPKKASTSSAEKNKQDSKNSSDDGTKISGSIFVPRKQSTTKSTIPLSAMDNKSVAISSLPPKPNSSQAMPTSTKNEQTMTIADTNSNCSLETTKTVSTKEINVEQLASCNKNSNCTTNWLPQMDSIEIDLPSFNGATTADHEMNMNEEMAKTEAYIQNVLYSEGVRRRRRRLPVFEEICPSDLLPEYCKD